MTFTGANLDKIESPITVAIDLSSLSQSGDPVKRQISELLAAMSDIKTILDTRLPDPTQVAQRLWFDNAANTTVADYLDMILKTKGREREWAARVLTSMLARAAADEMRAGVPADHPSSESDPS